MRIRTSTDSSNAASKIVSIAPTAKRIQRQDYASPLWSVKLSGMSCIKKRLKPESKSLKKSSAKAIQPALALGKLSTVRGKLEQMRQKKSAIPILKSA